MKNKTVLFLMLGVAFITVGCPQEKLPSDEVMESEENAQSGSMESLGDKVNRINDMRKNISYTIDNNVFKEVPEVIHTTILNQSREEVNTGSDYLIWRLEGKEWIPLEMEGIMFDKMMHPIGFGEGVGFDISLYPKEIKYTPGLYRISKSVGNELDTFQVDVEFELK